MKKLSISILAFLLVTFYGHAQQGTLDSWSVGINAGLYGAGGQVATSLFPNLKLRAGYDYLNYSAKNVAEFEVDVVYDEYNAKATAELTELKVKLPNYKVMLDFYPARNGIFCFTGGFYFGKNKVSTNGLIRDYQQLSAELGVAPNLQYEDVVISPNSNGSFSADLTMGNEIKPYFGIGLGRTIPYSIVGFKFELGMVNQGKYVVSSPNLNDAGNKWVNGLIDEMDLPVSEKVMNWWPMVNLTLSFRIM